VFVGRIRAIGKYIASRTGLYDPARSLYRSLFDASGRRRRDCLQRFYRQIVKRGDLVFDIGANIGVYSEIFESLGANVVAVEPLPENVSILQTSFYKKKVQIVQAGAGPQVGTGKIRRATAHAMGSMSREWIDASLESSRITATPHAWLDEIEISVTTLDTLAQTYGAPDFIKIDVEGYESSVLDGLSAQPKCVSFEFNPEILHMAQRCLEKPIFSPASECNFVIGEPEKFALDAWTSKESVMSHIIAANPESYGDIFVRRPGG
jgi:FkbM family methyltransferase